MKYKQGDRVKIKSLEWYNKNKDISGNIHYKSGPRFSNNMKKYCGQVMTIRYVYSDAYRMEEDSSAYESGYFWTDEMIEGLVEDDFINIDEFQDDNKVIDIVDEYIHRLENNECQIDLPEGYQFTDEDGIIINTTRIILEKKRKPYPKTYEECSLINGCEDRIPLKIIGEFTRLINARNAYWKLYGEEMGLGKPWEPDWTYNGATKYCIGVSENEIQNFSSSVAQYTLAFPTAEMRDAFYKNFKELIEQCKELL